MKTFKKIKFKNEKVQKKKFKSDEVQKQKVQKKIFFRKNVPK